MPFPKLKGSFCLILLLIVPATAQANGVGACVNSLGSSVLCAQEVRGIDAILDVTAFQSGLKLGQKWVAGNKALNKLVKASKTSINAPKKLLKHSMGTFKNNAKLFGLKSDVFKYSSLLLNGSKGDSATEKFIYRAKQIGHAVTGISSSSMLDLPYVRRAGKMIVNGSKLCSELLATCQSDQTSEFAEHGFLTLGYTISLASSVMPLPYVEDIGDMLTVGTKVYKTTSSNYNKLKDYYAGYVLDAKWLNGEQNQFEVKKSGFKNKPVSMPIECKYEDKTVWAKTFNESKHKLDTFQSKGHWVKVLDENGQASYIFVLKVKKRAILKACMISILAQESNSYKSIDPKQIKFSARRSSYTSPYPTAVSLYVDSDQRHTFQVLD